MIIRWREHEILLDDEDAHLVEGRTVYVDDNGYVHVEWGGRRTHNGQRDLLHRLVMKAKPGQLVDHRDGRPLDTRRFNLRIATQSQQNQNRFKHNNRRTGYKGVWPNGPGFSAMIKHKSRREYLGQFRTAEEAARAYDRRAIELWGEFARPNFPQAHKGAR